MGAFDKKKAFGIGGILTGAAAVIAVLANISEIMQLFDKDDKPEKPSRSVAVVETVDEDIEETVIEQLEVIEAVEVTEPYVIEEIKIKDEIVEQADVIEESVIEPETEPPTEPKPVSVYINDLQYMSCINSIQEQDNLTDNVGNMYHKGLFMYEKWSYMDGRNHGEGSADYYIQGKYTTFSGTVAVPRGHESSTYSAFFEIYGDGNLLYTSPVMINTSFPENFSIDITGVKLLTISYLESNTDAKMATLYDGLLS